MDKLVKHQMNRWSRSDPGEVLQQKGIPRMSTYCGAIYAAGSAGGLTLEPSPARLKRANAVSKDAIAVWVTGNYIHRENAAIISPGVLIS